MSKTIKIILWLVVAVIVIGGIWYGVSKKSIALPTKEPIKIGAILPLTGHGSFVGESQKNGIELAVEVINNQGGINGRELKIIYEDSRSDPKEAVSAFNRIVTTEKNVNTVIVSLSSVANALLPLADANDVNLIMLAVSLPGITDRSERAFRFNPGSDDEARKLVEFLHNKLPQINSIAVVYINDEFGVGAAKVFKNTFSGKIVVEEAYSPTETDFKTIITKIKASEAKGVYVIGYTPAVPKLMKQLKEMGVNLPIFANMAMTIPSFREAAGEAAEGTYYTTNLFDPGSQDPKVIDFVIKYQRKYNSLPNFFAAFAYDSINILKEAISKEGYSSKGVREGLLKIKDFPGTVGTTTIPLNRDVNYPLRVVRLEKGVLKEVYK
jgi:branched-chain amino acid transport system substrate-binding protein